MPLIQLSSWWWTQALLQLTNRREYFWILLSLGVDIQPIFVADNLGLVIFTFDQHRVKPDILPASTF